MDKERIVRAWLDTATKGIRFGPDRLEVERELRGHLEDKTADMMRVFHLDREQAEQAALAQMGDAEEIGREMARVHTPWLGYLWRASQVLAVIAACVFVLMFWKDGGVQDKLQEMAYHASASREGRAWQEVLFGKETAPEGWERLGLYDTHAEARLGNAEVSVDRTALWQRDEGTDLILDLRLTYDWPWDLNAYVLFYLWAEDDLGNRYGEEYVGQSSAVEYTSLGRTYGFGWTQVNLVLKDVPPQVQWVRFHYLPGTDLDLLVEVG